MCVNCGVPSCSSCNKTSFLPAYTSALKYDGPAFACSGKSAVNFEIPTCITMNQMLTQIMEAICAKNGGSVLEREVVEITADQVKALHTAPQLLLANSVTSGYDIHSVIIKANQVTTDYTYTTPADPTQLVVKAISVVDPSPGQTLYTTGVFLEGINAIYTAGIGRVATKMVEPDARTVITGNDQTGIWLTTGGPSQAFTLGDHTLTVTILYRELTA